MYTLRMRYAKGKAQVVSRHCLSRRQQLQAQLPLAQFINAFTPNRPTHKSRDRMLTLGIKSIFLSCCCFTFLNSTFPPSRLPYHHLSPQH